MPAFQNPNFDILPRIQSIKNISPCFVRLFCFTFVFSQYMYIPVAESYIHVVLTYPGRRLVGLFIELKAKVEPHSDLDCCKGA